MNKIYILLSLFLYTQTQASNIHECIFNIKINSINKKNISVLISHTNKTNKDCKSKLAIKEIPLKSIKKGKSLVIKENIVSGRLSTYSGIGPNGPINDFIWEFSEIKN